MAVRKLPVRTKEISLTGEYEGWSFTARMNPPTKAFAAIASGEFAQIVTGLARIIRAWNFVDEEGNSVGEPTEETIFNLPIDLLTAVSGAFVEELSKLPPA